jgi:hypothetical protein
MRTFARALIGERPFESWHRRWAFSLRDPGLCLHRAGEAHSSASEACCQRVPLRITACSR